MFYIPLAMLCSGCCDTAEGEDPKEGFGDVDTEGRRGAESGVFATKCFLEVG